MIRLRFPQFLLLALIAATAVPAASNAATGPQPPALAAVIPLVVDETNHRFTISGRPLTIAPGTIKAVTLVPTSAKAYHGVGIDGGPYRNVKGAWVLPGRSSSLTIGLESGRYTLFDSYKDNRALGYKTSIRVSKSVEHVRPNGRSCGSSGGGFGGLIARMHVKRTSCRMAALVGAKAYERWDEANFAVSLVKARGFTCRIKLDTPSGLQVKCRSGARRVHFSV